MLPPLPAVLVPALPFISLIATDWLRHSTLPTWANVSIALGVPATIALIWALIARAFTANIGADIVIVLALSYAVMALPDVASLRQWLQDTLKSPLAGLAAPRIVESTLTTSAAPITPYPEPTPLTLAAVKPEPPTIRRSTPITNRADVIMPGKVIAPGSLHGIASLHDREEPMSWQRPSTSSMDTAVSPPRDDDHGDPVPAEV